MNRSKQEHEQIYLNENKSDNLQVMHRTREIECSSLLTVGGKVIVVAGERDQESWDVSRGSQVTRKNSHRLVVTHRSQGWTL